MAVTEAKPLSAEERAAQAFISEGQRQWHAGMLHDAINAMGDLRAAVVRLRANPPDVDGAIMLIESANDLIRYVRNALR